MADNVAPIVDTGFQQPVGALTAIDVWTLPFLAGWSVAIALVFVFLRPTNQFIYFQF